MSEPTDKDRKADNEDAREKWLAAQKDDRNEWCYASQEEVRHNLMSTGYPENRMVFVQGKVEETIPGTVPEKIALLRLDTDWYESTYTRTRALVPAPGATRSAYSG